MELPSAEIMREMAKIANETATANLAKAARNFAETIPAKTSGRAALMAFADAIDSTNTKQYPKGVGQ